MTIGYYTDNSISRGVMAAFSKGGAKTAHIKDFDPYNIDNPFFYGILRGTGAAMRHLQFLGENFYYLDNGYFDAIYMNKGKIKDMSGKYRVVKNDMIEPINIAPNKTDSGPMRVLIMPPTPYTAFMYDTTPEDWCMTWTRAAHAAGHQFHVREKDAGDSLDDVLHEYDAVFAFNSIAVMKAIEMDKAVYTTHGVIRNADLFGYVAPYYDLSVLKEFYKHKQVTLEEIEDLGVGCLI